MGTRAVEAFESRRIDLDTIQWAFIPDRSWSPFDFSIEDTLRRLGYDCPQRQKSTFAVIEERRGTEEDYHVQVYEFTGHGGYAKSDLFLSDWKYYEKAKAELDAMKATR